MKSLSYTFKYRKSLGKGAYGYVDLVDVPELELVASTRQLRRRRKRRRRNNKYIPIAKKIFKRNSYLAIEIHNYNMIPDDIRKKYFVEILRYGTRTFSDNFVIQQQEDKTILNQKVDQSSLEMRYLQPEQWTILSKVSPQQHNVSDIFRELVRIQLLLMEKANGVYFDINPKNVFVSSSTTSTIKVKLIDFGGLFFSNNNINDDPINSNYSHQKIIMPTSNSSRYVSNNITYENDYYIRKNSSSSSSILPGFMALIATYYVCLEVLHRYTTTTTDDDDDDRIISAFVGKDNVKYYKNIFDCIETQKKFIDYLISNKEYIINELQIKNNE